MRHANTHLRRYHPITVCLCLSPIGKHRENVLIHILVEPMWDGALIYPAWAICAGIRLGLGSAQPGRTAIQRRSCETSF